MISLVNIRMPDSSSAVSTSGSVLVSVSDAEYSDPNRNVNMRFPKTENGTKIGPEAENVTISIDASAHESAWEEWFESGTTDAWRGTGGTYECETENVFVRQTNIRVRFIQ
jgi:hypothetical protein